MEEQKNVAPLATRPDKLPPIGDFFEQGFKFLGTHWKKLLIYFVPLALVQAILGYINFHFFGGQQFAPIWMNVILVLVAGVVSYITYCSSDLYCRDLDSGAVAKPLSTYIGGFKYFWKMLWVAMLATSIIAAGLVLSYLGGMAFFAISGILTAVIGKGVASVLISGIFAIIGVAFIAFCYAYFMLSVTLITYVVMLEEKKGMSAVMQAFWYTRGRKWGIFGRLFVSMLIPVVISMIIAAIGMGIIVSKFSFAGMEQLSDPTSEVFAAFMIFTFFMNMLLVPLYHLFSSSFGYVLWKHAKLTAGSEEAQEVYRTSKRGRFVAAAWVGVALGFLLAVFAAAAPLLMSKIISGVDKNTLIPLSRTFSYENNILGFSFEYPVGYAKNETLNDKSVTIDLVKVGSSIRVQAYDVAGTEDYFGSNINTTADGWDYIKDYVSSVGGEFIATSSIKFAGNEANFATGVYSGKECSGAATCTEHLAVYSDGYVVYVFTLSCIPGVMCDSRPLMDILTSLNSFYSNDYEGELSVYDNRVYGFKLKYPTEYYQAHTNPEYGFKARFINPQGDVVKGTRENFGISIEKTKYDLEKGLEVFKSNTEKKGGSIEDIKEVNFGGGKGYRILYNSGAFRELVYKIVKDGKLYEFNYYPVVDENLKLADEIAQTFEITEAEKELPTVTVPEYGVAMYGVDTAAHEVTSDADWPITIRMNIAQEDVYHPVFLVGTPYYISYEESLDSIESLVLKGLVEDSVAMGAILKYLDDKEVSGYEAYCAKLSKFDSEMADGTIIEVDSKVCAVRKGYVMRHVYYFDDSESYEASLKENQYLFDSIVLK